MWKRVLIVGGILALLGAIAGITYVALVSALIKRLSPPATQSRLHRITEAWQEPDSRGPYTFSWPEDFSRDITPVNCHSHNDYWRAVPLYDALAAGCVSFEADIWLQKDDELLVGHAKKALKEPRTLKSLYLDPLANIFIHREVSNTSAPSLETGAFEKDGNASLVLMLDFKTDGHDLWPVVLSQLEPMFKSGWLTYFDGKDVHRGPLTVVGSGNTPFDDVIANSTERYVFFDAPLLDVANEKYTTENSYYASTAMEPAIGSAGPLKLSGDQEDKLKTQIKAAADKGLVSRYWDTPSWPISLRDKVWTSLKDQGVGMLNVDDLVSATRWNWNWCVIAGLTLCG
ncbi:uncharacterized protein BDZ99DRAFT_409941 [Mytilinidion resinicola]|uniref:Altered inheritance of mitochondria protein 6 n=1 Tax=Mytilinidion resinicola TaxID=574789 RepID=A0A6A6Z0U0_9PEZI|nr:uncharacterized protein BDZ99DRAFT_409941 [Mytilinidion resinicola]KAF2813837.1 hypothetical protein BDZ99DRAFT_409941 [Mytilinidion resinicola]